jgi:hypothetical protein
VRRLTGPAVWRLSEGNQTPHALSELFRDRQRTQTQSSVRTLRGLRQQMAVRSCRDAGTTSREAHMRKEDPDPTKPGLAQTKVKGVEVRCASAPLSKASLHLRCSTPGSLRMLAAAANQTCNARSPKRAQEARALPMTRTYMDVAYPPVAEQSDR